MKIISLLREIKESFKKYDPGRNLLRIEIDGKQLEENIKFFKNQFRIPYLAAVLKSNAYGHGLKEIGSFLDKNKDVSHFVVDSIMEAKILRNNNVKKALLIVGYVPRLITKDLKKVKADLVINSLEQANDLKNQVNFPLNVHIKVDTGLHRHGIFVEDLKKVIEILHKNRHLEIKGLMSHLALPTNNSYLNQKHFELWGKAVEIYKKEIVNHKNHLFHILATPTINNFSKIENNMARIGGGIYGIDSSAEQNLKIKPILSFYAKVVNIKTVKKGEGVGYGFTWVADKDTKIAVVACGYYEGVPRFLSNTGYFYFDNIPLKILGRVSMNLTIVDVSAIKDLRIEDEIEVISNKPDRLNSCYNIAKIGGTIPYEILIRLSPQIKRIVKNSYN
ncbi:MAG: alanine racemase [Minisyncoccia bacterium]